MAAFREHITFSSALGVGYGVAAWTWWGFSPAEAAVASVMTGFGGMLPDLDSPTGKPGQVIFSMTAAVAPLMLSGHILRWGQLPTNTETLLLVIIALYILIRFGLANLLTKLCIHRGMFHSFPAMFISGEVIYLAYPSPSPWIKLLMAGGIAAGFLSHLVLDEVYSVNWKGTVPKFKKSFGTAMKWASPKLGATLFTWTLFLATTLLVGERSGIIGPPVQDEELTRIVERKKRRRREANRAPVVQQAAVPEDQLTDAPTFR